MKTQRPIIFSDPVNGYGNQWEKSILDKPDNQLDCVDFDVMFNTNMPIGTFDEVKYFSPLAVEYLYVNNDSLEFVDNLVTFLFTYESLVSQIFQYEIDELFANIFKKLTESFVVIHMNKTECFAKEGNR